MNLAEPNSAPEEVWTVIVQRYGDLPIGTVIEKALRTKLPKLAGTPADVRLLLLERDQGWVYPEEMSQEVERRREQFPQLASVSEVWIVDTATLGEPDQYVAFRKYSRATTIEAFEFYQGQLFAKSTNSIPCGCPERPS